MSDNKIQIRDNMLYEGKYFLFILICLFNKQLNSNELQNYKIVTWVLV
jgi:hypothetical protein